MDLNKPKDCPFARKCTCVEVHVTDTFGAQNTSETYRAPSRRSRTQGPKLEAPRPEFGAVVKPGQPLPAWKVRSA
jgi:hypothetical protein